MIKLLTMNEHIVNPGVITYQHTENGLYLKIEGTETKGTMKSRSIEWHNREDYVSLQLLLKMLGLDDYIEMETNDDMLYARIYIDDNAPAADTSTITGNPLLDY